MNFKQTEIDLANIIIDPDDFDARIHYAALAGDLELIKRILQSEPETKMLIDRKIRPIGATALRLAATGGHLEVMHFLLEQGVFVDGPDLKRQTPLFVAIKYKHLQCAKLLLEKNASPNGDEGNRCTPLYIASQDGFLAGVMLLLQYGADTESLDRLVSTPGNPPEEGFLSEIWRRFQQAIKASDLPVSQSVMSSPLHTTVNYDHLDCYIILLAAGAELDLRRLRPSLPETAVQQLSISHAIINRQASAYFAELFVLFGGYLWQKDGRGNTATDLSVQAPGKKVFLHYMEIPLKLQDACRISIRRRLGKNRLSTLRHLALPSKILDFLFYKDIVPESCLIYK